jgi:hypothetical protein
LRALPCVSGAAPLASSGAPLSPSSQPPPWHACIGGMHVTHVCMHMHQKHQLASPCRERQQTQSVQGQRRGSQAQARVYCMHLCVFASACSQDFHCIKCLDCVACALDKRKTRHTSWQRLPPRACSGPPAPASWPPPPSRPGPPALHGEHEIGRRERSLHIIYVSEQVLGLGQMLCS